MERKSLFLNLSEEHLMDIAGGEVRIRYYEELINAIREWFR